MTIFRISLLIIALIFLSGCDIYNLANFVIPDDPEFIAVVENLNTPEKVCKYMEENFTPSVMEWWKSYSPYQIWLANIRTKFGDCNDYATFLLFTVNYHGYPVWQILLCYKDGSSHMIAAFIENGNYNYSSNFLYKPIQVDTFEEVVDYQMAHGTRTLKRYIVYDYYMNFVERGDF